MTNDQSDRLPPLVPSTWRQIDQVVAQTQRAVDATVREDLARMLVGAACIRALESLPEDLPPFIRRRAGRAVGRTLRRLEG